MINAPKNNASLSNQPKTNASVSNVAKSGGIFALLLEQGGYLLQESGWKIKLTDAPGMALSNAGKFNAT